MTTDDLLKQGIAALNEGRKAEARSLLMQVVQQDERNEMAWLWLSGAVDTHQERRTCLENVLAINPNNGIARRGLESLIAKEGVRPLRSVSPPIPSAEPAATPPEQPARAAERLNKLRGTSLSSSGAIPHATKPKDDKERVIHKAKTENAKTTLFIVVVVILAIVACRLCSGPDSGDDDAEHSATMAWVMCKNFVEDDLKAPSTAKFPRYSDEYVRHLGDGRYRVSAYVDAENAFGAMIRADFVCTVEYVGDDKWQLESLVIE